MKDKKTTKPCVYVNLLSIKRSIRLVKVRDFPVKHNSMQNFYNNKISENRTVSSFFFFSFFGPIRRYLLFSFLLTTLNNHFIRVTDTLLTWRFIKSTDYSFIRGNLLIDNVKVCVLSV